MNINITIPDDQLDLWEALNEPELIEKVQAIVDTETRRLWHIRRCRPKVAQLPKPKGAIAELGDKLLKIYRKKTTLYDGVLPDWLAAQEAQVIAALNAADLVTLELLWNQQLWTNKAKHQ